MPTNGVVTTYYFGAISLENCIQMINRDGGAHPQPLTGPAHSRYLKNVTYLMYPLFLR